MEGRVEPRPDLPIRATNGGDPKRASETPLSDPPPRRWPQLRRAAVAGKKHRSPLATRLPQRRVGGLGLRIASATSRRPAPPTTDVSDSKRQRPRRGAALGIYQRVGCAAPAARVLLQDAKLDERVDVPARSVL